MLSQCTSIMEFIRKRKIREKCSDICADIIHKVYSVDLECNR